MLVKPITEDQEYEKVIPYLQELRKALQSGRCQQPSETPESDLLVPTENDLVFALKRVGQYDEADATLRELTLRMERSVAGPNLA